MVLKLTRCVFGYVWAASLLLAGGWLWQHREVLPDHAMFLNSLAVLCMAGGVFVFMVLVADELLPDAPLAVRGFLKTFVGVVWCLALVVSGWLGIGMVL